MAINYCVNCGEKLEEGMTECASCGEPVPQSLGYSKDEKESPEKAEVESTVEEDDPSLYADLSGFDVFNTNPDVAPAETLYPGPPDRTDVMAPVKGQRTVTEFRAPEEKKSRLTLPLKIAAGLAAVILAIAGIGLLAQPETQSNIQKQLEASSASASSAVIEDNPSKAEEAATSSDSSAQIADSQAKVDDDTAFEYLTATYDTLQSYNDRVYSCLQTYNGVVFSSDRTQREAAAGVAKSLLGELESDMKSLDAMNIGKASELYDDYQNVRRLLNDQYQRLAVVVESWDISLGYDTPYEHEDEILEPLRRDIGPSGVSTYLEDFDATYWESRPTR